MHSPGAQSAEAPAADCAFGDDAAEFSVPVKRGRMLDHELTIRHTDDERGVVQGSPSSLLEPRDHSS